MSVFHVLKEIKHTRPNKSPLNSRSFHLISHIRGTEVLLVYTILCGRDSAALIRSALRWATNPKIHEHAADWTAEILSVFPTVNYMTHSLNYKLFHNINLTEKWHCAVHTYIWISIFSFKIILKASWKHKASIWATSLSSHLTKPLN